MHWAGGVQVITEQRAIAGRIIGVTGHWAWVLQKLWAWVLQKPLQLEARGQHQRDACDVIEYHSPIFIVLL